MPEEITPQNENEETLEDLEQQLSEHLANAVIRRANRQMVAPTPTGMQPQALTPEQIEADESIIQAQQKRLEDAIKAKQGVGIDWDNRENIITSEFENVSENEAEEDTADINDFDMPEPESNTAENENYFDEGDFDNVQESEVDDSLTANFNNNSSPPLPTAGHGIEP